MSRSPLRAAWLLIAAASWTPRGANAYSIPSEGLAFWERAATSSDCASGFTFCPNANLPSNFCCSTGSTCDVLAGNTTVLCCPAGVDCSSINPITCDLSQQDADTHPEAPVKTTALNGVLAKCGNGTCCPFGYSCDSAEICIVNVNQNASPLQNVPTTTATTSTAKTSSTSSTTSSHTTAQTTSAAGVTVVQASTKVSSTGASSTSSPTSAAAGNTGGTNAGESAVASADDKSSGGSSTASIVGGVIGGLAGLLLVGAAVWFLCGRRLRQRRSFNLQHDPNTPPENKLSRSTSSFGNIINNPLSISSPKPQGDATAFRTDFIRKLPSSGGSRPVTPASSGVGLIGTASSTVGTVGYTYQNTSPLSASLARDLPAPPSPSPPPLALRQARDSMSVAPIRGMRNSLPRQQQQHQPREPSMEEINVGADPSIIGLGGNFTISPPGTITPLRTAVATAALAASTTNTTRNRSNDRLTTFSSLMEAADLNPEMPFIPGSVQSSPASRRR